MVGCDINEKYIQGYYCSPYFINQDTYDSFIQRVKLFGSEDLILSWGAIEIYVAWSKMGQKCYTKRVAKQINIRYKAYRSHKHLAKNILRH